MSEAVRVPLGLRRAAGRERPAARAYHPAGRNDRHRRAGRSRADRLQRARARGRVRAHRARGAEPRGVLAGHRRSRLTRDDHPSETTHGDSRIGIPFQLDDGCRRASPSANRPLHCVRSSLVEEAFGSPPLTDTGPTGPLSFLLTFRCINEQATPDHLRPTRHINPHLIEPNQV